MNPLVDTERAAAEPEASRPEVRHHVFLGVAALVFTASAALTLLGSMSMSAMGAVPMPGGWSLSMVWLRACGQTWPGVAASFLDMWIVMMVAMMLPSFVPMLWRYRESVLAAWGGRSVAAFTAWICAGYFAVWTALGVVVFATGVALAAVDLHVAAAARAIPIAGGLVVTAAGALQFSEWKARRLACCRLSLKDAATRTAWRHGLRLGLHCLSCCAGLTAILLVVGVMDWRAMLLVTVAITAERLAPDGRRVAHATGAIAMGGGLFLLVQATGLV
ncbi:DUF2182 domain-containing protein [Paraburkholderia sp. BCC1884]|uniref:DUF2182 domain-containing protein n=1 Tax=Paraburkholderia sp. BCC1884 TaxID=2562668 RepID=UPI001183C30B|nr:DUF2182 domain-containing protein [Paraburkholderia sp. BCC1884]